MNDKAQRCALVFAAAVATAPASAVQELNVGMAGTPNAKPGFVPGAVIAKRLRRDDAVVAGRSRQRRICSPRGSARQGSSPAAGTGFANPTAADGRGAAPARDLRELPRAARPDAAGGFGTLYGPNVDKDGNVTASAKD